MGGAIRRLKERFRQKEEWPRVLILGLDGAGKTSTLYWMKTGKAVSTVPTIGFNLEKVTYKDMHFFAWDVGGQAQVRALWRHYCANTLVLVYVVDSSDVERMEESKAELWKLLAKPELKDSLLLLLANQQDRTLALSVAEITEQMGLNSVKDRTWTVIGTCALTGEGFKPALKWMHSETSLRNSKTETKGR